MADLGQAIRNMVNMCNDNTYGYQLGGWGPYDYDCASSIITALRNAGFDTGAAQYTGNMSAELCARGWERLPADVAKEPGDILLNEVNHTAMYVGDNQIAEFSSDYDGLSGDSSGNEASVHGYYDNPWDCVLRWPEGIGITLVRWIPA
ncbi:MULTISPECIES: peptidoglycan amidohydrolase family protein [Clostridia]|uniref:peptidoglycan amidohydrolase family protein n=1 Tax=Clostridia TaxID=186801 RepID=UPI00067F1D8A|nr:MULTISPECIES: peptidoglycan amidohydrolase family protein [Clostridia]